MINDSNEFSREAWDARMGDEGKDFFKKGQRPPLRNLSHYLSRSFAAIRMSVFSFKFFLAA